ncbi:acylphosphatase [Atopobiaceae bacterium 24-176]
MTETPDLENGLERYRITFGGRCQGVGFRYTCADIAGRTGLAGWVRNEDDGTVSMELQGAPSQIVRFMRLLEHAYERLPWRYTVEAMESMEPDPQDRSFRVLY